MKIIFAIFAIAISVAWFALRDGEAPSDGTPPPLLVSPSKVAGSQEAAGAQTQRRTVTPFAAAQPIVASASIGAREASDLLATAIQRLDSHHTISALLRLRSHLFHNDLIGSGLYQQAGQGSGRQFRYELKTQLGNRIVSQLQVCDSKSLWTYRSAAEGAQLSRLDLARVRAAQEHSRPGSLANGVPEMVTGGIVKLLARLKSDFRPQSAEAGYLNEAPVWAIELEWAPAMLAGLIPQQAEGSKASATVDWMKVPQLPERGRLYLGYEDLFPRRLEFYRRDAGDPAAGQGRGGEIAPAVTLEFTDVRFNEHVDPRQFDYQPGGAVEDVTDKFLQSQGLSAVR